MQFRIADTFTDSLARLTGDEQKAAKITVFDLQLDPSSPGLQYHKLDRAKDKNFASVRVSSDIRLIVHKTGESLLVCYVAHHNDAYNWAERRKLETHPTTGAAQLVEIRETVREIELPTYAQQTTFARGEGTGNADTGCASRIPPKGNERSESGGILPASGTPTKAEPANQPQPKPRPFQTIPEQELLSYGIPIEWIADVRTADEDSLFDVAEHLPAEAAEALLVLATGGRPEAAKAPQRSANPELSAGKGISEEALSHPDAQRRFRLITDSEELQRALDAPWEKWTVFLHPGQRELVERSYNGPARVSGSAGTGKTIVALHRTVYLAKQNPDSNVLLTTFSPALATLLRSKIRRLIGDDPRLGERIEIADLDSVATRLYRSTWGAPKIIEESEIKRIIAETAKQEGVNQSPSFLYSEWHDIVDAGQLETWDEYKDAKRLGRRIRLTEPARAQAWKVFIELKSQLAGNGQITKADLYSILIAHVPERKHPPFDFVVVDEAQDVTPPQLRFLAALGRSPNAASGGPGHSTEDTGHPQRPNALFFAGDLGQRIFQTPFSWKSLGVDVRGRSKTLKVNYRTSHQIRSQADRLLGKEVGDVDGNVEIRAGTVSIFNGPAPKIFQADTEEKEVQFVSGWLGALKAEGLAGHEIGVFVRSEAELPRAEKALHEANLPYKILDKNLDTAPGHANLATMHLAKGLEFKAVVVMACDDEIIPSQARIESAGEASDLEEVYNTERHLLYVACTRARDRLLITSGPNPSEFLADLAK